MSFVVGESVADAGAGDPGEWLAIVNKLPVVKKTYDVFSAAVSTVCLADHLNPQ